jgi:hypothetical protein
MCVAMDPGLKRHHGVTLKVPADVSRCKLGLIVDKFSIALTARAHPSVPDQGHVTALSVKQCTYKDPTSSRYIAVGSSPIRISRAHFVRLSDGRVDYYVIISKSRNCLDKNNIEPWRSMGTATCYSLSQEPFHTITTFLILNHQLCLYHSLQT